MNPPSIHAFRLQCVTKWEIGKRALSFVEIGAVIAKKEAGIPTNEVLHNLFQGVTEAEMQILLLNKAKQAKH